MMATSVVVRTAPNRTRAINQTDQVAINKLASQQSGRFWRASKDDGFLSLGDAGEVLHVDYLTQLVRRYLEAAGIERPGACHLFRHSMATAMLEGGADVRFVQEMLGHASLEKTQLYTRVTIDKLKAVHAATHPAARALRSGAPLETASAESVLNALAEENEE
jgi:integrase/recombinase XerD